MYNDGTQERIIKEIAKKYNLDTRLVKTVVYHPIKFAKTKMENPTNNRPIRIRHFGLFTQKHIIKTLYRNTELGQHGRHKRHRTEFRQRRPRNNETQSQESMYSLRCTYALN